MALADTRDPSALSKLDAAERHLGNERYVALVWPWAFRFDQAKFAAYRAVTAAKVGRIAMAEAAFRDATAVQPPKQ